MTVGDKIRKYRLEQGYTQKELAIKAGLSESAVRNYELGNRTASQDQLEKIANALKSARSHWLIQTLIPI